MLILVGSIFSILYVRMFLNLQRKVDNFFYYLWIWFVIGPLLWISNFISQKWFFIYWYMYNGNSISIVIYTYLSFYPENSNPHVLLFALCIYINNLNRFFNLDWYSSGSCLLLCLFLGAISHLHFFLCRIWKLFYCSYVIY